MPDDPLSTLAAADAANMTEPSPGIAPELAAALAESSGTPDPSAAATAAGAGTEQFDPRRHAKDAAGFPKLTADGKRLQRKRGRPKKSARSAPPAAAAGSADSGDDDDDQAAPGREYLEPGERRAAAVRGADFFFGIAAAVGPAVVNTRPWAPTDAERDRLVTALDQFYERYGVLVDIPPGVALVGAVAMYVVPRVPVRTYLLAAKIGIPLPAPVELDQAPPAPPAVSLNPPVAAAAADAATPPAPAPVPAPPADVTPPARAPVPGPKRRPRPASERMPRRAA